MGCWHGCGPWHVGPCRGGWYAESAWGPYGYEEESPVRRRRYWRGRGMDRATAAEALETRLANLRDELERVEAALADLREPETEGAAE